MSRLICLCKGIKEREITQILDKINTASLELIQEKTGAGSNCGRCISTIEAMLNKSRIDK
ncbi:(2Fe-2S)-binding protein [Carboxylicivirga taeanensis]|uniref:(2Fe-2S)-binding protein n=1 Tax=Carboxylicivirga taeanensis TaxID=1416875 RepID=UPI003F6DBA2F